MPAIDPATQLRRMLAVTARDRSLSAADRRIAGRALAELSRAEGIAVSWDPDCKGDCARNLPGDFYPAHEASSRCQSGGRNHCTCDTCF